MIKFDFTSKLYKDLWRFFGVQQDEEVQNRSIPIPRHLGKGYLSCIKLGGSMGIMIHDYQLSIPINGQKTGDASKKDTIVFSFRNVLIQNDGISSKEAIIKSRNTGLPSVQVSSGDMDIDLSFPAHTHINAIVITIHKSLLSELLHKNNAPLLQTIFSGNKPYLFEEFVSGAILEVAASMLAPDFEEDLLSFYYRIKSEELIFLFFVALLKRKSLDTYPLNTADVKTVFSVRDKIIADLTTPPDLTSLAIFSGMSESKLNRLFKQIFGNPIYNYHQKFRIHEAAARLKTGSNSVSEVGYQLGFTNLSHFSHLFKRYMGENPKKFSKIFNDAVVPHA